MATAGIEMKIADSFLDMLGEYHTRSHQRSVRHTPVLAIFDVVSSVAKTVSAFLASCRYSYGRAFRKFRSEAIALMPAQADPIMECPVEQSEGFTGPRIDDRGDTFFGVLAGPTWRRYDFGAEMRKIPFKH